jgi:hypothetical protein
VNNNNGSCREDLEERAREDNSNLQRLIEGIGGLLTASAELLGRLQQILSGNPPKNDAAEEPRPDKPTPNDR